MPKMSDPKKCEQIEKIKGNSKYVRPFSAYFVKYEDFISSFSIRPSYQGVSVYTSRDFLAIVAGVHNRIVVPLKHKPCSEGKKSLIASGNVIVYDNTLKISRWSDGLSWGKYSLF